MSLLDWVARKQRTKLTGPRETLRTVQQTVDTLERKVAENAADQIRRSSFHSVHQRDSIARDSLVMQRVLGQQPARADK